MFSGVSAERLLLTLWVGSLFSIGYLAVPMAFSTMGDISLAGDYAGKLFHAVNLLGIGCALVLILSKLIQFGKKSIQMWRFWLIVTMLVLTLIFSGYLQPEMSTMKQMPTWSVDGDLSERFAMFHAISKNLYLLLCLLGLALVVSTDDITTKAGAE